MAPGYLVGEEKDTPGSMTVLQRGELKRRLARLTQHEMDAITHLSIDLKHINKPRVKELKALKNLKTVEIFYHKPVDTRLFKKWDRTVYLRGKLFDGLSLLVIARPELSCIIHGWAGTRTRCRMIRAAPSPSIVWCGTMIAQRT